MRITVIHFHSFCLFSFALAYPGSKPNHGITGGQPAAAGQFPYIVSVQQCFWLSGCSHYCSGTIISPIWIVTAAQCYESGVSYKVLAGVLNLNETNDYQQLIDVNQTITNSDYGGAQNPVNDIALMLLNAPLIFNQRVWPILLPEQYIEPKSDAVLMGWGDTTGHHDYPNTLQYVNFTIISASECKNRMEEILGPDSDDPFDASIQICTSDDNQGKSICSGDGGAPLVTVEDIAFVGIVSWGISPCGTKGAPSVYTKVSSFIDWIIEHRT